MFYKIEERPGEYCIKSYSTRELLAHDVHDRWVIVPRDSNAGYLLSTISGLSGPEAMPQIVAAALFDPGFMTPCPDCDSEQVPCVCDIGG